MSAQPSATKFFEVEGVRVPEPQINGIGTWLNLFNALQQQHPGKHVVCGWEYPDGTTSIMCKTAPKEVPVKGHSKPRSTPLSPYVEEPGDMGSSYDNYLETKHAERNGLWK